MKARNLLIGLTLITLLITSTFSEEDSCPSGMRKMYVDDTNMISYGSARKWLGAVCFFNFPGSLFFQRKVLIEPRFQVHLKAAVDAIEKIENSAEQNIYGFTIIISGSKSTISGLKTRTVTGGASTSQTFSDIGYGNFVNTLVIEFDFVKDYEDPDSSSFSIKYCRSSCTSSDYRTLISEKLNYQRYVAGQKNQWDFRFIYANKKFYLYSGPNTELFSISYDLEDVLGTNIAYVGYTGFMESTRGEINLQGTFICEDNYVITKMVGYYLLENDGFYDYLYYEPGETIQYGFEFINSEGKKVPHAFGYDIWNYTFYVTQDCDTKGSYNIRKYDNYTLIITTKACTTVGKHTLRINEAKKGPGYETYYYVEEGDMEAISLVGYNGVIGTVPTKSDTTTLYLNFGDSSTGDFIIKEDLNIILDFSITDQYGNGVTLASPETLFTLKIVNSDGSTTIANDNTISYSLVENGDYYQMTVSVMDIGTYQIEQNDYMEKPIKFTVIPGEASATNSYCVLEGYTSAPTVNLDTNLYYLCYLRDSYSNEIPINTFIQNSKYEFVCSVDKTWPSTNSYSPAITNGDSSYKCSYKTSEIGNFAFNGYLRLKSTKEKTKLTTKLNQFYVRGKPAEYTIKKIYNPSTNSWIDIDTATNTIITYVADSKGFITAIDFAESTGNVLISSYESYPSEFSLSNLNVKFYSPHDENYSFAGVKTKFITLDGKPYIGIYTSSETSTNDLIKKSSFYYNLKFTYFNVQKSAAIQYVLNIGTYVTCFHDLNEANTIVNIPDPVSLITGEAEKKLGTIILNTNDNNLYNYNIGIDNIKINLIPSNSNINFKKVALSIDGTYDVYASSSQDYDGVIQIEINGKFVKNITFTSEPSQACYLDWINPNDFSYKNTEGKEIYYEYDGEFDNGNLLIYFKLRDKNNQTIVNENYFTKFPDISSEEYGTDKNYFSISFDSSNNYYIFRDNVPYANTQHGWVFKMRETTCNYKYYLRYDGKKGGSPLSEANSYFTILSTQININNEGYVDVIYKDQNDQLLGLQEEKLQEAKSKTVVTGITGEGVQVNLAYDSTTSNYALRYKAQFTTSGVYTITVKYDNSYDLKFETTNKLTVIDNIYNLASSKFTMILDNIVEMSIDTRVTINKIIYEPFFQLDFYSKDNVKTIYDKNIPFKLVMSGTDMPQTYTFNVDKTNNDYVKFEMTETDYTNFHSLRNGDYILTLSDDKSSLVYPIYLIGDNDTDYSNNQYYDISKTDVKPATIEGIAGKTYTINIEFRAEDGLRWNRVVDLTKFKIDYTQILNDGEITLKTTAGPKKGQVVIFVTQTKTTVNGPNTLTFTYEEKEIPTKVTLTIKCASLDHLKLHEGPTFGNVICPPKIYFEPLDIYENLYTDLFDPSVTQEYLNTLTVGTSKDKFTLGSNNTLSDGKYLVVQYLSTISTDIVVTSDYFENSYQYRIYSGPISKETSFAEIKSTSDEVGKEFVLLITPKDLYNNNIDGLNETHLKQFLTIYETIEKDYKMTVTNCYLIERSSQDDLRILLAEEQEDQEKNYTNIECSVNITKAGILHFVVDYVNETIECKDGCEFIVMATEVQFSNTKTYYTNKGYYLTVAGPNVVEVGTTPVFELTFFDKYLNQLEAFFVKSINVDAFLNTDVKLCVTSGGKTKSVTICPSSGGDDNENKFKYLTNGDYKLYIQDTDNPDNIIEYPITITGGSSEGSSESVDFSKTYLNPESLSLVAGEEGYVNMELRTADRKRKNYWYPDANEKIKIAFDNDEDTCTSNVEKGGLPGQYVIGITCTKATESNKFSITVESTTLSNKISFTVGCNVAYYLEVENLEQFTISSDKYTWKTNPTNDDDISFSFKFKDKYQNYITYTLFGTDQYSIASETYGSGAYYFLEYKDYTNTYIFTDKISEAVSKHTWNIIVVESNRKYSFIYAKEPGAPDLSKSYWTIDKTSYIIKDTSTVTVYLLDKLGVNLGTLEGNLDSKKDKVKVITNKDQDYNYNYNSIGSDNIIYTYTYEAIGDYKVMVTYDGEIIGNKKDINVAYQEVELKNGKLYYNVDGKIDNLMLITTQTNINSKNEYPFFKFYLYTADNKLITLYDHSLEATCAMTFGDSKWEMVVDKKDSYLHISYKPGFEENFSKLPLGLYYIEITFDNEVLKYPLYLLGDEDVSPSSDYDLERIKISPTEIEAFAGEEKEVDIEFRASDGLRYNYPINPSSFGISNSYELSSEYLIIEKLSGEKGGQMKLKIKQTISTTGKKNNLLTLSYQAKTISQTISLKIQSAELKTIRYVTGAEDGTVINPPTLQFLPYDEYGNICTQVFDSTEYPKEKLEALIQGISINGYTVTSNVYINNNYLYAQYGCTKVTTIQVTSSYFSETLTYKLTSGPIDSSTSYAQVVKNEGVVAGDITTINIYPKDKYSNDVISFSETDITLFDVQYSLNEDAAVTISNNCKKKEESIPYINCEVNITKSGNIIFGADYNDKIIKCINCEFNIVPDSLYFPNTKVVNQNTNKEMSLTTTNTLTVTATPKFILSFYDRFMNSIINEDEVKNLQINTNLEVTDVKLCVENSKLNKISSLCKSTSEDENVEKWKYISNGNSYKYIVFTSTEGLTYPVAITGGYSDGDSGPVDVTKTYIDPNSLTLTAGVEGEISLELRTTDNNRKNYWYSNVMTHLGVLFPDDAEDCSYTIAKGNKPGQYTFKFICTQQRDTFENTIIVENTNVPQLVYIKVVPNEPTWSKLYTTDGVEITKKNLGSVSVEDKFQMVNKLYDKYNNLITNIDFDLSILKIRIAPSISVKNYEYSAETVAQKTGDITVTLKSTYAGEHIVVGAFFPLTNYTITFTHGEPSADNSILEVSQKEAFVGETIKIYITPYDKYSNLIDANEYKDISPYQVKYTNEGNTTKIIMQKHSIEAVNSINVLSYPGEFYVRGYTNFFGYIDTNQIKCVSCRVNIKSREVDFESSLVMRYESSKSDYEVLKNGTVEKNKQEEPVYRLYPRDQYLNSIDYIPEDKIKTYRAYLQSQSESVTYHLKLNNEEYTNQPYAEFVIDDEHNPSAYSTLVRGYFYLIFTDDTKYLIYNISLVGDKNGGSNEPADYQMTHINDQNLKFIAGESGYLMLEIRTAKNIRKNDALNVDIQVKSCDKTDTSFKSTMSKSGLLGVFKITITTQKANTYPKLVKCPLDIYIDNILIESLHPEMEVSPNIVVEIKILEEYFKSGSNTELKDGNADTNYVFEVASFDQYNNLAETVQDTIGLKVTYKGGSETKTTSENEVNSGYRKYTVTATKAGTYVVSTSKSGSQGIYLRNEASFLIYPGAIDLTKTVIKEKTTPIQAGDRPAISIVAYDKYSNVLDYTKYINKFNATFIDANNKDLVSSPSYDSGAKKVFYTSDLQVTIVGNTKVEVIYDGKENIDTSKIIIEVLPGEPYAPYSILARETSSGAYERYYEGDMFSASAEESLKLVVTLYDIYKNFVNNLPATAQVKSAKISGNYMKVISFSVTKNTDSFSLDFEGNFIYVLIYRHLVRGVYYLDLTVSSALGSHDFRYYINIVSGDEYHGNGDYVLSKCVLTPNNVSFTAGNYQKFTMELRTQEGLLYNDDIDVEKDISIGNVDDNTFTYTIAKNGSDYGVYIITVYSEKKGEYELNVALTDPKSYSGEKKNINPANYKVTPDPIPDKNKTVITNRPGSTVDVGSTIGITFELYDKFSNKIEKSDNIIQISYFTLLNNGEPYSYTSLNFDQRGELHLMPKYPPKTMSINLLYNNGEKIVYIFPEDIEFTIKSSFDLRKTQIISSNKDKIYAGQVLDMWLYTLDVNNKCYDNGDMSTDFEIEITGPLDTSKQYTRKIPVTKTKITEEGSSDCNNEYQINNDEKYDPVYKYAGKYLIKVKYQRTTLLAQYNQACYPLGYDIRGFNLKYNFNPDSISILDTPAFTITGTDKYGNTVSDVLYDDIKVSFTLNNKDTEFETISKTETNKGTLNYQVSIHIVGSHQLHIFYKGEEVQKVNGFKEDLPKFTILTGPCYAENNTNFDLSPLDNAEVSLTTYFSFQCYDKFNNKITKGGEKFTVNAEFISNLNQGESIPLDGAKVVDNGDGTYKVEFFPSMKGTYLFNLLLGKDKYGEEVRFELTEFTCSGENNILCPNKKVCVDDIMKCLDNGCNKTMPFRCKVDKVETCVKSQTDCDCPDGFYKCPIMKYCVRENRKDMCPYFFDNEGYCLHNNMVSNYDGICRKKVIGPNQRVCPIGKVLCADLSCRDNYYECVDDEVDILPLLQQRCIGQQIVDYAVDCPSSITCSSEDQVVCPNGECVDNEIYCPAVTKCNEIYPYLCHNNVCAKNYGVCAESISCGENSLLCSDNICRENC